jgi:hypothetical protein
LADDVSRIRRFVDDLARRERGLLAAQVVGRGAWVGAAGVAWMVGAVGLGVERSTAAAVLVLWWGVGGWLAVALPQLRSWRPAGSPTRQARLVEALVPDLGGRLITTVERVSGPREGESEAIMGLVARRAAASVEGVSVAAVHPAGRAVRLLATGLAVWLVLPVLTLFVPGGPGSVVSWWASGASALAALSTAQHAEQGEVAHVGDLVLRYAYPDYTGLEPKVVPNSTGDVAAPPGTRVDVTARTGEPVEAAGLEAYERRLDATVEDEGRTVTTRFDVASEPGTYRLVLYRGGEPETSRAFAIEPQADLPPDVTIDAGKEGPLEVALDQSIALQWRARDDYGVRSVHLQIEGADVGPALYRMTDRRAEVFDRLSRTPRALGLSPGDRVQLRVAAFDNDTISGSKPGYSPAIEVVVLGARGLDRRAAERQAELLKEMVPVLARHLTDPWPAGETSGQLADWGATLGKRYRPLFEAVEAQWAGMSREQHDASVMSKVVDSGTELIRYTQVAFEPGSDAVPADAAFEVTAGLRDEAIVALEDAILAFHRMLRNRALRDVAKAAQELADTGKQLEELLADDNADAQAMLSRLDQLERMMQRMMQEAARLDDGGLREYVNQRQGEMSNLMDEVREALARGDLEEARKLMERLAEQLQQMSDGLQQQLQQRQGEADDAQERAQQLIDDLERLENKQQELQEQTRELREQEGGEQAQEAADLWAELQQEAAAHAEGAKAYEEGLQAAERPFWERTRAEAATEMADRLRDAATARDLRGSFDGLRSAERAWEAVAASLEAQGSRPLPGPGARELAALRQRLARIRDLLEQLRDASASSSPEQREQAQQLEQQQRDLDNELKQVQEQAQQLSQDFPVQPQGMQEALEEASERMQQAGDDLRDGQPMAAEGSQGVAGQRLRDAKQSMQQAMQQAQQQAQAMQQGQGQGQGDDQGQEGSEERTGGQGNLDGDLEIPTREEFTTPEAYRRALLEGMEGDVPEEYRAMKKRYYEELVHQ